MKRLKFFSVFIFAGFIMVMTSCQMTHHEMDHSAHRAMMQKQNSYTQSSEHYQIPDIVLFNQDGEKVKLNELLSDSEPYALNFIFTTCTTICPILTASFSQMQRKLGADAAALQLISITIDPEYDTPDVLKEYAAKVGATKNWTFLTGSYESIVSVEKAFNAYIPDKMNHRPIYLFKIDSSADWIRIEGLASGADLADIYQVNSLF